MEIFFTILFRHTLKMHYEGKTHECHCGSIWKYKYQLRIHQQTHEEKMNCKVCHREFTNEVALKIHWKEMHLKTHGTHELSQRKS